MAILNRAPYGRLGNPDSAILNAQGAAWLAGLKYAKKNVFIQSPTFNAVPVVDGVLNAVRRGIECTLYIDVGYNDGGEVLPGQGGINEEVSKRMYAQLNEEEKGNLRFYWYTGQFHAGSCHQARLTFPQERTRLSRSMRPHRNGIATYVCHWN